MSVQTHELFCPMLAMFVWTFLILLRNVQVSKRDLERRAQQ